MAEIPEEIDPSEATEAKLCAYLEGQLEPAERAEIEEYLKNYPQHRKTLNDLAATRRILRSLPRELAPADVAEAFRGHMERSMLLDGSVNDDSIVHRNHWPQLALAAAIIVLAVGLGIVIYIILPGSNQKYSIAPPVPVGPVSSLNQAMVTVKPLAQVNQPSVLAATPPAKSLDEAAKTAAPTPTLVPPSTVTLADNSSANKQEAYQLGADVRLLNKDTFSAARFPVNSTNMMRLVVHTDDPVSARKQVQNYLVANNVLYQTMGDANAEIGGELNRFSSAKEGALKLVPATQPIVLANNSASVPATQAIVQAQILDRDRQRIQNTAQIPGSRENLVFVARSMTREQATLLNATLSTQQVGQTTDLYFPGPLPSGAINLQAIPATQPTTAPLATTLPTTEPAAIAIGDSLTVTVAQLVGPGVDKTNTVRVADNGTISLPMIEPIPAAGELPADLEKQIAAKYQEANLIPDATVTIIPTPTTQPTETAATPATQPTEIQRIDVAIIIEQNPPTTQPAIPTTMPKSP